MAVEVAVEQSWARIVRWLHEAAPRTARRLRPPAPASRLDAAQARFPEPWPADLRRWYELQDGGERGSSTEMWCGVLPGMEVLSLSAMLDTADVHARAGLGHPGEDVARHAGEIALSFLPQFVPVAADGTGCSLFVDTRPGPLSGCVTEYAREDADTYGPVWAGVGAMLQDVADALESMAACNGWQPVLDIGVLTWQPADA